MPDRIDRLVQGDDDLAHLSRAQLVQFGNRQLGEDLARLVGELVARPETQSILDLISRIGETNHPAHQLRKAGLCSMPASPVLENSSVNRG